MTFGKEGEWGTRVHDLETVKKILDVFQSHGHTEVCHTGDLIDVVLTF